MDALQQLLSLVVSHGLRLHKVLGSGDFGVNCHGSGHDKLWYGQIRDNVNNESLQLIVGRVDLLHGLGDSILYHLGGTDGKAVLTCHSPLDESLPDALKNEAPFRIITYLSS